MIKIRRLSGAPACVPRRPGSGLRAAVTAAFASAAFAVASAGLVVSAAGTASAASADSPMPTHVFAPYWEAWAGDDPLQEAQASGNKYLSAAFIQTQNDATADPCTAYWDGQPSTPISNSQWGKDFAAIQAAGGDVIPSFGGYTADTDGLDIADRCSDVSKIAAVYESVITTYNVSRIDLDVEAASVTDSNHYPGGIERRNQAVAEVEAWAAANNRSIQFSYTLPTATSGLLGPEMHVLQDAQAKGAKISVVNIMTFDYWDGTSHEMANDTKTAAQGLVSQLQGLYPNLTSAQLWGMVGVTEMIGIDDYNGQVPETFSESDANTVLAWAEQQGINTLSFWALERDNGGCPGVRGSNTCSGLSQPTWYFSKAFEPFTGNSNPPPQSGFSVSLSPNSSSVIAGSSATATVNTAVTSGSAQSVALSASGAPSGVSVSFSPPSVTAGVSSTMAITTSSTTPAGTYPITVTGTGSSDTEMATYMLTVTGGGPGGGSTLTNGDFESGSLSPWVCQSGDSVQNTTVHSGKYALEVAPSSSQTGECDQALSLSPNTTYTLSGWVEGNYAFLGVSGGATNHTWSSSNSWNQLSISFTTDSTGAVTVYVNGWYGFGNVYADDLTLTKA